MGRYDIYYTSDAFWSFTICHIKCVIDFSLIIINNSHSGALLVKRSSGVQLRKTYFGGGTVDAALATEDFHVKCKDLSER